MNSSSETAIYKYILSQSIKTVKYLINKIKSQ